MVMNTLLVVYLEAMQRTERKVGVVPDATKPNELSDASLIPGELSEFLKPGASSKRALAEANAAIEMKIRTMEESHLEEMEEILAGNEITLSKLQSQLEEEIINNTRELEIRRCNELEEQKVSFSREIDMLSQKLGQVQERNKALCQQLTHFKEIDSIYRSRTDFNGMFIAIVKNEDYTPTWFINYLAVALGQEHNRFRIVDEEKGNHIQSCDANNDDNESSTKHSMVRLVVEIIDYDDTVYVDTEKDKIMPHCPSGYKEVLVEQLASLWLDAKVEDVTSGLLGELGIQEMALLRGSQSLSTAYSQNKMTFIGRTMCLISHRRMVVTVHHMVETFLEDEMIRLVATDVDARQVFVLYLRASDLEADPEDNEIKSLEQTTLEDICAIAKERLRVIRVDGVDALCYLTILTSKDITKHVDTIIEEESVVAAVVDDGGDDFRGIGSIGQVLYRETVYLEEGQLAINVLVTRYEGSEMIGVTMMDDKRVIMIADVIPQHTSEPSTGQTNSLDPQPTLGNWVCAHCQSYKVKGYILEALLESAEEDAMLHLLLKHRDSPPAYRSLLIHSRDRLCILDPCMPLKSRLLDSAQSASLSAILQQRYSNEAPWRILYGYPGHVALQNGGGSRAHADKLPLLKRWKIMAVDDGQSAFYECTVFAIFDTEGHHNEERHSYPAKYLVEVRPVPCRSNVAHITPADSTLGSYELQLCREEVESIMDQLMKDRRLWSDEDVPARLLHHLEIESNGKGGAQLTISTDLEPSSPPMRCSGVDVVPSTLGWKRLFSGAKRLNDINLVISVYTARSSDNKASLFVSVYDRISRDSWFAAMPADGPTDQPLRLMLCSFNLVISSDRDESNNNALDRRRFILCLSESPFPHIYTVSVVDTSLPNQQSFTFLADSPSRYRNESTAALNPSKAVAEDRAYSPTRPSDNLQILSKSAVDDDESEGAFQHFTKKVEESTMLRDGYVLSDGVKEIDYRFCKPGFDGASVRQDGTAETAIPVVTTDLTKNGSTDYVEVLYATNRSISKDNGTCGIRIVVKAASSLLAEHRGVEGRSGLILDLTIAEFSSSHLIVPHHDDIGSSLFTSLIALGDNRLILSVLQDIHVIRLSLGSADSRSVIWQGVIVHSTEMSFMGLKEPASVKPLHKSRRMHVSALSGPSTPKLSDTLKALVEKDNKRTNNTLQLIHRTTYGFQGGKLPAVLSLYLKAVEGELLVKCYRCGGKEGDLTIKLEDLPEAVGYVVGDAPSTSLTDLNMSRSKEFGELILHHSITFDPSNPASDLHFNAEALKAEIFRRRESAEEDKWKDEGGVDEGFANVHGSTSRASRPLVNIAEEALAKCYREITTPNEESYVVLVELYDGCSESNDEVFNVINYTLRVSEVDPKDKRLTRTIWKRDIHESDLIDWLSAYSREDLLSAIMVPQLETAIVSKVTLEKMGVDNSEGPILFDGPP
ncbi:hypothetical protein FOL47_000659 [Perkinsus chesapeaki]|uniref:Uncharacterized protein n=1 Tax=Perkinsus chesapeaki TaxID=330153 RepID=A0A7J6MN10_PERCH|nr:hypothetical protein FOL47_000659 [Perkinsus chesapeaki]